MTSITKFLTDIQVKNEKPKDKPFKLSDRDGLYVLVNPAGSKLWRMNYRFDGKQKTLSFGKYPDISLAQAREYCAAARKLIASSVDPAQVKKDQKNNPSRNGG